MEHLADAGERCSDGSDCLGICIFTKEDIASASHKRVEGTCSQHEAGFGCYAPIPRGATRGGLVPRTMRLDEMCVD